jgi:hypothetical protein
MKVAITASVFEDAMSIHERVEDAVIHHFEPLLTDEYHNHCVHHTPSGMEQTYGTVYLCYMFVHKLAISTTLNNEIWIKERATGDSIEFDF